MHDYIQQFFAVLAGFIHNPTSHVASQPPSQHVGQLASRQAMLLVRTFYSLQIRKWCINASTVYIAMVESMHDHKSYCTERQDQLCRWPEGSSVVLSLSL